MNRISEWTANLRQTNKGQAKGALCEIRNGVQGFCCLGLGSLQAGLEPEEVGVITVYNEELVRFTFGESSEAALAPVEFVRWLYPDQEFTGDQGYDLEVDWPKDLTIFENQEEEEEAISEASNDLAYVSNLNDEGFTFAQIADIVDYFGVTPAPGT